MNLAAYTPILGLVILSTLFAAGSIFVSSKLAPRRWTRVKSLPYECGIVPEQETERERFPIKFYLVAMLFIIFDIETVFLYPWAVAYSELEIFGLIEMVAFIVILLVAYAYVWMRGGLEWEE